MPGHHVRSPSVLGELQRPAHTEGADEPSLARVEAFSDAVFAFGVTLLILVIRIPHPTDPDASAGLLTLLTQQWRIYLVYALSFMFVGNNWVNHRVMFSKFVRIRPYQSGPRLAEPGVSNDRGRFHSPAHGCPG